MRRQMITFTALPNGIAENGDLKLTVHVAPRLETNEGGDRPTLGLFSDFVDWPATIGRAQWTVNIDGTSVVATLDTTSPTVSSVHWSAVFSENTFVRPFTFPNLDEKLIRSYPTRHIANFIRDRYTRISLLSPDDYPDVNTILNDPNGFGLIGFGDLEGQTRHDEILQELDDALNASTRIGRVRALGASAQPDPPRDFLQVRRFHRRRTSGYAADEQPRPELPDFDFHQALALFGHHGELLRLFGLAIDLHVSYPGSLGQKSVQMGVRWPSTFRDANGNPLPTEIVYPKTQAQLDADFRPRADPQTSSPKQISGWLPAADASHFEIVQVDLDGAAIKALDFTANVQRGSQHRQSAFTPQRYSLPSLRSAGLSLCEVGRAARLVRRFDRAQLLNTEDFQNGGEPVLFADDVTKAWRVDIYDSIAGRWFSLMQRVGEYEFQTTADTYAVTDEGAMTTAVGGRAPEATSESDDLYLQESLFHWYGWSLVAGRPGKIIDNTDRVSDPVASVNSEFPLSFHYRPQLGSLPRLRFGREYRARMRAVDICGNSLSFSPDNAGVANVESVPVTYRRFEPISSPTVMLRLPRGAGEQVDRLVLRSNYDAPAVPATTERHIAPEKISQLMAETHGLFDTDGADLGGSVLDPTRYAELVTRDAATWANHPDGALDPGDSPAKYTDVNAGSRYFNVDHLNVSYLPDIFSRGAVLRFIDGALEGREVTVPLVGTGPWPNYETWRIVVTEGTVASVLVEAMTNVIAVVLPKAETVSAKLSCKPDANDLDQMGVFHWALEGVSNDLERTALIRQATAGRHWMLTPWRVLTFVHAVRQPLVEPAWQQPTLFRPMGSTFAGLSDDDIPWHRKSTGQVDLEASWKDWIDDGPEESTPSRNDAEAHERVAKMRAEPHRKSDDERYFLQRRHEFGDTKHRRLRYKITVTSAFVEYFVNVKVFDVPVSGSEVLEATNGFLKTSIKIRGTIPLNAVDPNARDTSYFEPIFARYEVGKHFVIDAALGMVNFTDSTISEPIPPGTNVRVEYVANPVTRDSSRVDIIVPSSARPLPPNVDYLIPTFEWSQVREAESIVSTRRAKTLRVWLDRPWWSSGEGEQLGVVTMHTTAGHVFKPPPEIEPYVSMWGFDPLHIGPDTSARLSYSEFPLATQVVKSLKLAETNFALVDIAAHDVAFDESRDQWYADIEIDVGEAYLPFVRLALARYQEHSLEDAEISPIVLSDFMQVAPDRVLTLTHYARKATDWTFKLVGRSYADTASGEKATVTATLQFEDSQLTGDMRWRDVGRAGKLDLDPSIDRSGKNVWQGRFTPPDALGTGRFRLIVAEYERLLPDQLLPLDTVGRLVHQDIIEFDINSSAQ